MTPRERAEALARSWWKVSRPLCVWHATYNRPTAVESSRTEAEAWSKVADVTAPLADDIARAIKSALAERDAGEAERVREAEMARDVAWVRACDEWVSGGYAVAQALHLFASQGFAVLRAAGARRERTASADADIAAAIRAARGAP